MSVIILENNLNFSSCKKGITILNLSIGTIKLKNNRQTSLVLDSGFEVAQINGIIFSIEDTITVNPNSIVDLNVIVNGTPINSGTFSILVMNYLELNGDDWNPNEFTIDFNVTSGCERYIAIVVDESGSITGDEPAQIRNGLTSFIDSQTQSNTTLSIIGMSDHDADSRTIGHVLEKRISDHRQEFLNWVNNFRVSPYRVGPQSDYWASGLGAVDGLTVTPDIIIIITDGLQVSNTNVLQDLYSTLNEKSHIFVYGVTPGDYETTEWQSQLSEALDFYLNRTAVVKTSDITILNADYLGTANFSDLGNQLAQLTTDLADAQVGCMANVSIIQNNLTYPDLKVGTSVQQQAGSLRLKNKSRIPLTLEQGTLIHDAEANLGGVTFTIIDTVTIPAQSEAEVAIQIQGTPLVGGNFSDLILIENVNNPNGFAIGFSIKVVLFSKNTLLQSPDFTVIAAGSKGYDSTKGIHLRWAFSGTLGENHIPKGNLFTGVPFNFNKPDDFVTVYRSPYVKVKTTVNLDTAPNLIVNNKALWLYNVDNKVFYVHFKNKSKYNAIKSHATNPINPRTNHTAFIQAYGEELIEIENKTELFFAAELNFTPSISTREVKLETLSVAENTILSPKIVSSRKTYDLTDASPIRVVMQNGRSIQFKAKNCSISSIDFEMYSNFIEYANENNTWVEKGKFGLSTDDVKVFKQLEPRYHSVHGKWLNHSDGEYVNTQNYRDKWNKTTELGNKNIKKVVEDYIRLSENSSNLKATEYISLIPGHENDSDEEKQISGEDKLEVSNLNLLNIAANDYHIARMLGLGTLDIEEEVYNDHYVYIAEYTSVENGINERQHLSMSIPTALEEERLPIPVRLEKIVPGLNAKSDTEKSNTKITDDGGYSFDGRKRYLSLFMEELKEFEQAVPFFNTPLEFDASKFTFPIYAGVHQKNSKIPNWKESAIDYEYYNINKDLKKSGNEPIPIILPEAQEPLLNVSQEEIGDITYYYRSYGLNLFSRATSGNTLDITSTILPKNILMPPTGINPLLIVEENPLMFTSTNEQIRLALLKEDQSEVDEAEKDETCIRLLFDYNAVHEMQNYIIPDDMSIEDAVKTDTIYNDTDEVYADKFEIFFRKNLPQVVFAKIIEVNPDPNSIINSIITIESESYTLASTGETIPLNIDVNNLDCFVGGILTAGEDNYIIQKVIIIDEVKVNDVVTANKEVKVHVVNQKIVSSIVADGNATIDSEQIKPFKIPDNKLCSLVENMLTETNWNPSGAMNFEVEIPSFLKEVHREIIQKKKGNEVENRIEKTRGYWKLANITPEIEKAYELDSDGNYVLTQEGEPILLDDQKHQGLYKISFTDSTFAQHPSYKADLLENSIEWANGMVRLFTKSCFEEGNITPIKTRKEFKVVRALNIGSPNFELIIKDTAFEYDSTYTMKADYDAIITGNQEVNYYPSYRVYLLKDEVYGLTKDTILPQGGESTHYSIFGVRSYTKFKEDKHYFSKISPPSPMYAVKVIEPKRPEKPLGGTFATRPDFFKRSTYTFTTEFNQKPHGVLYYRANDEVLLGSLYKTSTIEAIRTELKYRGGANALHFNDRWSDFLNFEENEMVEGVKIPRVEYKTYPSSADNPETTYRFPMPDNDDFIKTINEFIKWHNESHQLVLEEEKVPNITEISALNQVVIPKEKGIVEDLLAIHFIEQVIHATFVPLTEVPVIYDLINANRVFDVNGKDTYVPTAKKQSIKDKNGYLLKPTDPDFDMAPMMKIVGENKIQFTDFTLDGTSNNLYFYGVKEMDIQMNFSPFSPFSTAVRLVPANAPQAPEIKRIMPVLENPVLGINPAIQIELNPFHPEHNIKKISIYRALNITAAQSIRTMTLVKEVVVGDSILAADFDNVWQIYDEFEDLENIPFGEGLFYRLTVSKEIEYEEIDFESETIQKVKVIDYAPSQPSKITATIIADNVSPESPELSASGTLSEDETTITDVVLYWAKTVHNGKYHLYKMNGQGNWGKIQEIISNNSENQLTLDNNLTIQSEEGEAIYHHFKLIAENASGMYSSEEKILTLFNNNLIEL